MKALSQDQKDNITSRLLKGESTRTVAKALKVSKTSVTRIYQKMDMDKENRPTGAPAKVSPKYREKVLNKIQSGALYNAVQVTKWLNPLLPKPVCAQTVRNILNQEGLHAVVKAHKPLLKQAHRKKRLRFAEMHINWTIDDWMRVLWSDETKMNMYQSDGKVYVWKKPEEPHSDRTTVPTVKFGGGNLMVWGCMGWNGVGQLVEVQGNMDANQYVEILEENLEESFGDLDFPEGTRYFQQDNDPKHTSAKAWKFFEGKPYEVLEWPSQSPDLNPIEHLWCHFKRQLAKYNPQPNSIHKLWENMVEEWNKISVETCRKLIESMPRRLEAVIKAKGGHTDY